MWTQDNVNVIRGLNSESIDLVYTDHPVYCIDRQTPYAQTPVPAVPLPIMAFGALVTVAVVWRKRATQ